MSIIEKACSWMEEHAKNNKFGYDQTHRDGPDYDCSSAVFHAWEAAGLPVLTYAKKHDGCYYTGNLRSVFMKYGFKDVTSSITLSSGKGLKRGDILLNDSRHVAMYVGNGKEVEASINEKGTARGGKTGDQTGKEFLIRNYRNYPWKHILRYEETTADSKLKSNNTIAQEVIKGLWGNGEKRRKKLEAAGYKYEEIQKIVNQILRGDK